jgi:hypothetical protein
MRNAENIFVGKPEGKIPFQRPRRRWENNIRTILGKLGERVVLDSCGSGQGPVTGSFEHGNEPSGSIEGEESLD